MWFNISVPCAQRTTAPHNDVLANVNTLLSDHCSPCLLPPSQFPTKIPFLMASISGFLLHRAMKCSLCCGGCRADVNTAFNYKSNSKRATLRCPQALRTKAQTAHIPLLGSAGKCWEALGMLGTTGSSTLACSSNTSVFSVRVMPRMFCCFSGTWFVFPCHNNSSTLPFPPDFCPIISIHAGYHTPSYYDFMQKASFLLLRNQHLVTTTSPQICYDIWIIEPVICLCSSPNYTNIFWLRSWYQRDAVVCPDLGGKITDVWNKDHGLCWEEKL